MTNILHTIQNRRAVYPGMYKDQAISTQELAQIFEASRWAPNHKKTEPWRYIAYHSESSRKNLSEFLGNRYEAVYTGEKYSAAKHKKVQKKVIQSGCVLAIILQRDEAERVPEWEEIAALACSVQNMWLKASEMGIGSYWSSPSMITTGAETYFGLQENERCMGLFYMGHWDPVELPAERRKWEDYIDIK